MGGVLSRPVAVIAVALALERRVRSLPEDERNGELRRLDCPPCLTCNGSRLPVPWFPLRHSVAAAHVLATPFPGNNGTADPWSSLELLQTSTQPSIAAQSDRNFIWVVMVNRSTPADVVRRLRAVVAGENSVVVEAAGFEPRLLARLRMLGPKAYAWTTVEVGIALHRCATADVKTRVSKVHGGESARFDLVGWGAIREWLPTGITGATRTIAQVGDIIRTDVVTRVTRSLAAVSQASTANQSRTIILQRFFPLRLCHASSQCAQHVEYWARDVDRITECELYYNYNISLSRLAALRLPSPRGPEIARPALKRDVTLVVQSTCDRLWSVRVVCKRWHGPMAVVVFLLFEADCTTDLAGEPCFSAKRNETQPVRLRLVRATDRERANPTLYPVNRLRNIGIVMATTSHVFVADADFWPDTQLYSRLSSVASADDRSRVAVVVPSFEVDPLAAVSSMEEKNKCQKARNCAKRFEKIVPSTFKSLVACLDTGNCYMFDDARNPEGHSTTNLAAWLTQNNTKLRPLRCVASARYEPYLMLRKNVASPRFDPQFTGYGKNKISLMLQLRLAGYHFFVLPRSFLTHIPHVQSKAKSIFMDAKRITGDHQLKRHRVIMNSLFEALLAQIRVAPPGTLSLPECSNDEARWALRGSRACRLTAIAKRLQAEHPKLRSTTDWKRRVLGYSHVRTYSKCPPWRHIDATPRSKPNNTRHPVT